MVKQTSSLSGRVSMGDRISRGLTRVKEIYQIRSQRAKQLKAEGKHVFGYLCLYPPVEMMTAFDLVPYRIFGDAQKPITKADVYMATVVCPFLRSVLEVGMEGEYDFLDGVVMARICDVGSRMPHLWNIAVRTPYSHYIDIPHTNHKISQEHFKGLLKDFQKTLEEFTGKELTPKRLIEAIKVHNQQRALARELYDLRRTDPPLISGTETIQVMKAVMSLPVEEGNELLTEVVSEVKGRKVGPAKKPFRLLVWGSIIDDTALIDMIESLEANVVIDDTCVGSRAYFGDVELTNDPMDGLVHHYLVDIKCPRTMAVKDFNATRKDYMDDIVSRFGYLGDYARDWNANGVILQTLRYCDTHCYDVPPVKDYLDSIGLRSIYLERDYNVAALAPLRTRIQGFLETIS